MCNDAGPLDDPAVPAALSSATGPGPRPPLQRTVTPAVPCNWGPGALAHLPTHRCCGYGASAAGCGSAAGPVCCSASAARLHETGSSRAQGKSARRAWSQATCVLRRLYSILLQQQYRRQVHGRSGCPQGRLFCRTMAILLLYGRSVITHQQQLDTPDAAADHLHGPAYARVQPCLCPLRHSL